MTEPRRRLVISEDDLAESSPPRAAPAQPRVRADYPPPQSQPLPTATATDFGQPLPRVAAPGRSLPPLGEFSTGFPVTGASPRGNWFGSVQGRNIVAAACGVLPAWAIAEALGVPDWTASSSFVEDLYAALWVGIVGFFLTVVYVGWEQITGQNWNGVLHWVKTAGPIGAGVGAISGFVADGIYIGVLRSVLRGAVQDYDSTGSVGDLKLKLYLVRALGWGIFGLGIGFAVAWGSQSRDKLVNGLIGGAVGGVLGGLVFVWCAFHISSGAVSRLVGLVAIAVLIGGAIGVVERLRRDAWLHLVAGPMAGKEFIVYGSDFTFGSSPTCDVTLAKDAYVAAQHAAIRSTEIGTTQSRLIVAHPGCTVTVNGAPVAQQALRTGDVIGIGSTSIAYSERAVATV
jgi:hypothetical protein